MSTPQTPEGPWGDPQVWVPPAVEQPPSILQAVRLMWVGAGLSALSILISFLQIDEIRDEIRESDSSLTADELDTAVAVGLTFATIVGLVAIGLWLWMASANGRGKAWARTVATVLGGLNLLFTLIGMAAGQLTTLGVIVSIITIVLAVTILVLLYRPDSSRYYDAMTAR